MSWERALQTPHQPPCPRTCLLLFPGREGGPAGAERLKAYRAADTSLALLTARAPARLLLQGEEAGQLGQNAWERALHASPPYDNGLRDSLPACAALVAALSHHQWQLDGFVEEDLLEAQVEEVRVHSIFLFLFALQKVFFLE